MEWIAENWMQLLAVIGGVFGIARTIVALTPTDKDDQLLKVAETKWETIVGVLALILGIDTTQGVGKKGSKPRTYTMPLLAIVVLPFVLSGCFGPKTQASRAVSAMEVSAIQYSKNMNAMVDAFIADYRENALARIDEETNAALQSVTKPDGSINIKTAQAILNKKLQDYGTVERKCIEMRRKPLEAYKDIEHLLKYSEALQEYFGQQASTAKILEHSSDEMLKVLDRFVAGKAEKGEK